MSYRIMRLIIFFDLPMVASKDLAQYRIFRRFLIKNGFIMMQQSVYSRLVLNNGSSNLLKRHIANNLPKNGLVQMLEITEKQFAGIEYLVGKRKTNIIDSDKRIIEL